MASLTTWLWALITFSLISFILSCGNPIGTFGAANFGFGNVIHINSVLCRFFKIDFFLFFSNAFHRLETLPELLMKFRTLNICFSLVVILNFISWIFLFSLIEICIEWVSKHRSNRECPAVAWITLKFSDFVLSNIWTTIIYHKFMIYRIFISPYFNNLFNSCAFTCPSKKRKGHPLTWF